MWKIDKKEASMEKIIFFNIAWMKKYEGQTLQDVVYNGGKFVKENGFGHEVCNFLECKDGYCYGYVQPHVDYETINISKHFEVSKTDERIDNVLVVWCATRPEGGRCIVGWYKHATVYRYLESIPLNVLTDIHKKNGVKSFYTYTKGSNVTLLEENQRTACPNIKGRGVWFAENDEEFRNSIYQQIMTSNYALDDSNVSKIMNRQKRQTEQTIRDQNNFRKKILRLDKKCVITRENVKEALEAAHVISVADGGLEEESNGMMLRADMHRLFDAGLLRIDDFGYVHFSKEISKKIDSSYNLFDGFPIEKSTFERIRKKLKRANELMDEKLKKNKKN